jgi:hypothetical protein
LPSTVVDSGFDHHGRPASRQRIVSSAWSDDGLTISGIRLDAAQRLVEIAEVTALSHDDARLVARRGIGLYQRDALHVRMRLDEPSPVLAANASADLQNLDAHGSQPSLINSGQALPGI